MTLFDTFALLLLAVIRPVSVTDPIYPPNTLIGGTTVAAIDIASGAVAGVLIIQGDEPFASSSRAALASWRFTSNISGERVLSIVQFRTPNLFTVGSGKWKLNIPRGADLKELPWPIRVAEPGYPPNSIAQGSVIVRLEIDESGRVSRVEPVKKLGDLTAACVDATNGWGFVPALDSHGRHVPSQAFAVCVFRPPVIAPRKTK